MDIYAKLPQCINSDSIISQDKEGNIFNFIEQTLGKNASETQKVIESKLIDKAFVLDPKQDSRLEQRRNFKKKRKLVKSKFPTKALKAWTMVDLPKEQQKYELYLGMHLLWQDYMKELLSSGTLPRPREEVFSKLIKADYHGAIITVVKSTCPSFLNLTGIVIRETQNMFYLISPSDKAKGVPKTGNVFSFTFQDTTFMIFGNHFRFDSAERSTKKFKPKPSIML